MNNVLISLAIKAGKAIIVIISTQLVNYLSSEEFTIRVKALIEQMVSWIVKIVIAEQRVVNED